MSSDPKGAPSPTPLTQPPPASHQLKAATTFHHIICINRVIISCGNRQSIAIAIKILQHDNPSSSGDIWQKGWRRHQRVYDQEALCLLDVLQQQPQPDAASQHSKRTCQTQGVNVGSHRVTATRCNNQPHSFWFLFILICFITIATMAAGALFFHETLPFLFFYPLSNMQIPLAHDREIAEHMFVLKTVLKCLNI